MLKLKKVAITGGVASGKSAVCKIFRDLGAFVIDADKVVHQLLSSDTDLAQQVVRLLGKEILENGMLSRQKIADKVFKDPEILDALEKLLHPALLSKMEEFYHSACEQNTASLFVAEIPLLYEIGWERFFDVVIALQSDEATCRRRFEKNHPSPNDYEQRMKRQWPTDKKKQLAHYTLYNNNSLDNLQKQVVELNQTLLNP